MRGWENELFFRPVEFFPTPGIYFQAEISSLIGYSEVNAFSRAFKNWIGMTVTDYKKQQGL
ncbi:TPA: hypothetical protein ACGPAL_001947 [Streptococcus suis]